MQTEYKDNFCFLGGNVNNKCPRSLELHWRVASAVKDQENKNCHMLKSKDQNMVFSVALYRSETWTLKKQGYQ